MHERLGIAMWGGTGLYKMSAVIDLSENGKGNTTGRCDHVRVDDDLVAGLESLERRRFGRKRPVGVGGFDSIRSL
jgi:hypothetical protein